jgi:AAA15 family ATPase/GTPase
MLFEFRAKNFRSFREEVEFSMAASPDSTLETTNTRPTGMEKIKRVLNTAAIYGANASGKSNLIRALQFMQSMVLTSNQVQPSQENNLTPFRLRPDFAAHPTKLECTFLIDNKRFQYGFEFTRRQVLSEWLLVYERAKPQVWFSRNFNAKSEKYEYTYSEYFTGPKKVWESATRKEVLFLTTAIQLNNEQLKPLYLCFAENLVILPEGGNIGFDFSTHYAAEPQNRKRMVSLINAADTGISAVSFTKRPGKQFQVNLMSGLPDVQDMEINVPEFGHAVRDKVYNFEYGDESAGTQILFSLSGPVLDILQTGKVLIVDELDRSLHPLLVQKLVQMFNNPKQNPKGAQLIFTTHDVSLLDSSKMRRDQIWFAEKDAEQVSHLSSLLEFSPRKREAFEKGYLGGRYGGIPILGDLEA